MPALPPKYAVYWVSALPGVGSRRPYAGYIRVDRWGSTVAEAAQARAAFHMQRPAPKGSAAWLRPCSDAQSGLLASTSDEGEALNKWELEKGAGWAQSLSTQLDSSRLRIDFAYRLSKLQ